MPNERTLSVSFEKYDGRHESVSSPFIKDESSERASTVTLTGSALFWVSNFFSSIEYESAFFPVSDDCNKS